MQKTILLSIFILILVTTIKPKAFSGTGNLLKDSATNTIQAFVPDPSKSQINSKMTGKIIFAKDGSGNVNIKDWLAIRVNPTSDCSYYYNNDLNKTAPLSGGVNEIIFVSQPNVTSVTIQFGNGTASVQGM